METKSNIKRFFNDSFFLGLSFNKRKVITLFFLDLLIIFSSLFLGYLSRYLNFDFINFNLLKILILYASISYVVNFYFQFYEYPISSQDQDIILKIEFFCILIFLSISFIFFERSEVPRSIPFIISSYKIILILLSRFLIQKFIAFIDEINNLKNVVIIGNNEDATILKNLVVDQGSFKVKFFYSFNHINDKRINYIDKIPVIYNYQIFEKELIKKKISKVFFVEDINSQKFELLKTVCKKNNIEIDFAYNINNNLADHIFNLNIKSFYDQIFDKEMHGIDLSKQNKIFKGQNILITGGVGTIGNAIYDQLKNLEVNSIHIIDNSEYGIFNLNRNKVNLKNTICHLGSINDENFLDNIFEQNKIDIVFHAAAFKHVGIVQNNLISAINNNIFGTEKILNYVRKFKIKNFILISSDKAVEPSNYMGITKRICELLIKNTAKKDSNNQKLLSVRFGNVAGSSGSVIPIFLDRIKLNKDLIVTDPKVNRFFMSSTEAAYLVTLSLNINCNNGDILFFDMGKSFNIKKLAEKMLSMFPSSKSKVKIATLNKNEKISEILNFNYEKISKTNENKIFIAKSDDAKKIEIFDKNYQIFKEAFNNKKCSESELIGYLKKCLI